MATGAHFPNDARWTHTFWMMYLLVDTHFLEDAFVDARFPNDARLTHALWMMHLLMHSFRMMLVGKDPFLPSIGLQSMS